MRPSHHGCPSMSHASSTPAIVATVSGAFGAGAALAAQVPVKQYGIPVVTRRFVRTAHRLGLAVHVWTIDDPEEMERLVKPVIDGEAVVMVPSRAA